jgi:hypothetical protein
MAVDEGVASLAAFGGNCADRFRAKPVASTSWHRTFQKLLGRLLGHPWDLFASGQHADLTSEDLERRGHPSFGTVTLSQLLAAGAVHDMTRLHQVSRILATSTAKP